MIIQGLQKLTLLDFPGKVACTVFTAGCNFRCPFCHNAPLVLDTHQNPEIPQEDIFSFLQKRQGVLDGVCVTDPARDRGVSCGHQEAWLSGEAGYEREFSGEAAQDRRRGTGGLCGNGY